VLTLMSPSEQDLVDLIAQPAAFERRHGLRVEEGACPPPVIFERALQGMRSAPGWAALLCTRLYVLDAQCVVGSGGVKFAPDEGGEVEIGYGIAPAFFGRGIGTAGARAITEDAFARGVRSIIASTRPDNVASWRLLQRIGFTRAGEVVDPEDGLLLCWRREAA
jgi:ribosomal-protein-alanine N-acetyltransferase